MSRFKTEIQLNKPNEFVNFITKDFFDKENFTYKEVKGEGVWQYGVGLITSPQFIKVNYNNGVLFIEAWLKFSLLPGMYCGEMGVTGFVGAMPKKSLKGKIDQLILLLNQSIPTEDQFIKGNGQTVESSSNNNPIPVYTHDTSSKATLSLVFGLISLIGTIIPIVGVILAILGIVNSRKGMNSKSKGLAVAGLVISIIGLVLSILSWILGIMSRVSGI